MPPPETGWRRNAQVATGAYPAQRHRCFGVGQVVDDALAVLKKRLPLEGQCQLARRPQHQPHPEPRLQGIQPATDDRRRHALRTGCRGQTAAGGSGDKAGDLFKGIHMAILYKK